jgi:hypothetical protein
MRQPTAIINRPMIPASIHARAFEIAPRRNIVLESLDHAAGKQCAPNPADHDQRPEELKQRSNQRP